MHRYITRACVAVATGVALSTAGAAGVSAAGAAVQPTRAAARIPLRAVSPGTQLWAKRYNGPHGEAQATSVAVSPNGSTVFVTGYSLGSFGLDYGTVAYNATTGAQVWAKRYNNPSNGNDQAYSVTVSPSGSTVFVTGFSSVSSTDGRFTTIAYNAATE